MKDTIKHFIECNEFPKEVEGVLISVFVAGLAMGEQHSIKGNGPIIRELWEVIKNDANHMELTKVLIEHLK